MLYPWVYLIVATWVWNGGWQLGLFVCGLSLLLALAIRLESILDDWDRDRSLVWKWSLPRALAGSIGEFGFWGVAMYVVVLAFFGAAHEYPALFNYPQHYPMPGDDSLDRLLALGICWVGGAVLLVLLFAGRAAVRWYRDRKDAATPQAA